MPEAAIGTRDFYEDIAEKLTNELGVYFVLVVEDPRNSDGFFYTNGDNRKRLTGLRNAAVNGVANVLSTLPNPPPGSGDEPSTPPA